MISSKGTTSTRDMLNDNLLTFNCYAFSRGIRSERPKSRRWVSAEQCLCTQDPHKIFDATLLYTMTFTETSDEEDAEWKERLIEKYPDIPPGRIGVFRGAEDSLIQVPPHFLDVLWVAALAADSVQRSIGLTVQAQDEERWAVFEVSFHEKIADDFEVRFDKGGRPQITPPRAHPAVVELRGVRARLRSLAGLSGVAVIAVGVFVALWFARHWH